MIYNPREDSLLLQKYVKTLSGGRSFLDLGSGSGIQAETALKAKAKSVLATDINPESIKLLKSKGIKYIKSDLFDKIKSFFDLIAFNPPYLPDDKREDPSSALATSGGHRGDEVTLRFLNQASKYLNPRGKILLITSSLTPKDKINDTLKKQKLKYKVLEERKFFMEVLEIWEISKTYN
jgi:release factor glutamine methyltransferase